jgi:hypothetical protein
MQILRRESFSKFEEVFFLLGILNQLTFGGALRLGNELHRCFLFAIRVGTMRLYSKICNVVKLYFYF